MVIKSGVDVLQLINNNSSGVQSTPSMSYEVFVNLKSNITLFQNWCALFSLYMNVTIIRDVTTSSSYSCGSTHLQGYKLFEQFSFYSFLIKIYKYYVIMLSFIQYSYLCLNICHNV